MTPFSLPLELTSFVGRAQECRETAQLLARSRIVTLTGAGGCGKTRLALHVAYEVANDYPQGVCWVELAALADAVLILQAVAKTLNLSEQSARTPTEAILDFLRDKELLLVLDNCEHLLTACAELAQAVLHHAPGVHILATSREPLAVYGETLYPVAPLAVPPSNQTTDPARFDAIRLFVERAHQVLPGFALTAENAPLVAEICRRLDGIPLALELASARVNVFSLEQMAQRLDARFLLQPGSAHNTHSHHHTLRAALDWSFDLLTPREQCLFRRLAVFAGGCALDEVEAVCADDTLEREQIAELLFSLVNKSLVVAETLNRETARYHFLEPIRQYAQEKLTAANEAAKLHDRFLAHFVLLAEETEPKLRGPYQNLWLNWMEREQDNFRLALEWSLESHQPDEGLRIAGALYTFWLSRGYFQEGVDWSEKLLAQTKEETPGMLHLRVLMTAGHLSGLLGKHLKPVDYANRMVRLAEGLGEPAKPLLAHGLLGLGSLARNKADYETAFDLEEKSARLFRELGDRVGLAFVLQMQGVTTFAMGDFVTARAILQESLALASELQDAYRVAEVHDSMGDVARGALEYTRAQFSYEASLALFHELGSRRNAAGVMHNLGHVHLHQGNVAQAQELFRESLAIHRELGNQNGIAECLRGFAAVGLVRGLALQAARLLAAANAPSTILLNQYPAERNEQEHYAALIHAALGESQFQEAQEQGRMWTLQQAIDAALALPSGVEPSVLEPVKQFTLSARELEIVTLIAEGKPNGAIAAQLVLSKRTVEKHVANILEKLDFANRAQIARWATENHLIPPHKP